MWREVLKEACKALAVQVGEVRPDQWIALGAFLKSKLESLGAAVAVPEHPETPDDRP